MGTSWRCWRDDSGWEHRGGDSGWEHRGGGGEVTVDGNIVEVLER